MKRTLNRLEERLLLALHRDIRTTGGLIASLEITRRKFYTIIGTLEKHGYIKSLGYATWKLLPLGDEYVTTYLEPALVVSFKDSKVQDFLTLFPEPYRGVMRLAISSYIAKQSKIFDQKDFDGAFPATVLVGEPGIGKTPIGEAVCRLQGLKFKDHKVNVEAINKGEFGGRWAQKKGGKWVYNLSYWFGLGYLQVEEPERIVNREVSNLIRFILHGDKTYKKDIDYENRVVPFLTLNLPRGKSTQTVMEKVTSVKGLEPATIKRNVTLFCNPYRGYLGDPYKFFGRVMKDIPAIDLNFPVVKLNLALKEKDLLIRLIHNAMKPEFEYSYCDKRGVEIQVLGYHALSDNKDITSVIYQVVKDRLQALESLGLVRPGWRDWYNKEWLEYVARADPTKADAIRRAIARQKEVEDSIPRIDLPGIKHGKEVDLAERHLKMLDELRDMRDLLDFPLTRIKNIEKVKGVETKIKDLCRRYKALHKGLRGRIQIEIEVCKDRTEDNVRIGNLMVADFMGKVQSIDTAFKSDIRTLVERTQRGLGDIEIKKDVVEEIQGLITDLWKGEEWQSAQVAIRTDTTKKIYKNKIVIGDTKGRAGERRIRAIRELREVSKKLRSHLATVVKSKGSKSLPELKQELREAKYKSGSWLDKYERAIKSGWNTLFYGKDKPKPPTTPEPPPFNGRPFDQGGEGYMGRTEEDL
jgi:hypothetical protein